jgi:hypothetical protein
MRKKLTYNMAAGSFTAEYILKPLALANKLQAGSHPFAGFLLGKFSPPSRDALAKLAAQGADPGQLADLLAGELSAIAAAGQASSEPSVTSAQTPHTAPAK